MRILHSAVASALLATTMISTPAMAAKPPIADTSGMTPQEVCDAQLTPDENSDFVTHPENENSGEWATVDTEYGDPVGDAYGVGTPSYSGFVFDGSYFRNGGSPNVWGGATATTTYPQTGQMYETTIIQQRTTTFDCVVSKVVGSGSTIEPAGLQSVGNSTLEEQEIQGDDQEVVTEDDFVIEGETVNTLICISPNNATKGKPGTWTQKHGFTGSCSAASIAAGNTFIPSNNAPIVD